jgi:hypothetical protein
MIDKSECKVEEDLAGDSRACSECTLVDVERSELGAPRLTGYYCGMVDTIPSDSVELYVKSRASAKRYTHNRHKGNQEVLTS